MLGFLFLGVIVVILVFLFVHEKSTNAMCVSERRLDGRGAVVTGGTSGMGLQVACELARRGAHVTVGAPEQEAGVISELRAAAPNNPNIHFYPLDLASFASVRRFAAHVRATHPSLHLLINNAGVGSPPGVTTADGLNFIMQVNYYGAVLLTFLLLPLLKATGRPEDKSRIVTVSSVFHWIGYVDLEDKLGAYCLPPYANSKFCLVMFARELTKRLKGSNVVINNVDPGAVGTGIFVGVNRLLGPIVTFLFWVFFKTPWQGAQTTLHAALDEEAGRVSGQYFKNCRLAQPSKRTFNDKLAIKLFEESVRLVKLTDEELEACYKITK